jgi:heme/copper-type cytochrome/quinol oxidase subunit 3
MSLISDVRILLLGLWLGAACFFSFAVAPSAFAVLPSREAAGAVVNRTLAIINYSGLIIGLVLLASSCVSRQSVNRVKLWLEQGLLLFLAAACAFGQFVIGARLQNLRGQIGRPIDELATDDSLRVAFNNLHGYSVTILIAAMVAAVTVFFLLARRARNSKNL